MNPKKSIRDFIKKKGKLENEMNQDQSQKYNHMKKYIDKYGNMGEQELMGEMQKLLNVPGVKNNLKNGEIDRFVSNLDGVLDDDQKKKLHHLADYFKKNI